MARPQVYWPRPVEIATDAGGVPRTVNGIGVEAYASSGWSRIAGDPKPLRRQYFELTSPTAATRSSSASRRISPGRGRWFEQRA